MTHPFKFGDRVRVKDSTDTWDKGVVLDTYGDIEHGYFAVVCFEHYDNQDFRIDEIEPVPHPDTVRLDWLLENAGINVGEEDYYRRKYIYDRAAIDAAMNKEKNND